MSEFDLRKLPAQAWADEIDRFADNLRRDPVMVGDAEQDSVKLTNMDDRISFVAHKVVKQFDIRYGRNKYNDKHSLNATKTLMIYNPYGCIWLPYSTVADIITSSLNKNLSADSHVEALADAIAAQLGTPVPFNTIPALYSGTRYQLFLNGIYDLVDDELLEFGKDIDESTELFLKKSKKVKIADMGFTEKHMHNLIFTKKPEPPVFEDELPEGHPDGDDWDFREWLLKLNDNNERKVEWLLYVMGLAILPCVNIGANIVLRGDSGSGKSTVGTLVSKMYTGPDDGYGYLYDNTVGGLVNNQHTVDTMNEDFPFRGSLTPKVNFVHLSEMNGIRMTESAGTLFDKFADNDLDAKQLHSQSFKLSPSPTLFMEGTKWATFDTVKNGVERRALPIALTPTSDLKEYTAEGMDKRELFENEKILQWLVYACFKAIRHVRNNHKRLGNIHVNLMREELPDFVQEWRTELISGGDEITAFYDIIKDAIIPERPISFEMLHDLYIANSERRGSKFTKTRPNFTEAIISKFEAEGYVIINKPRRFREQQLENIGINIENIAEVMEVPKGLTLTEYSNSGYGRYKSNDWFTLE